MRAGEGRPTAARRANNGAGGTEDLVLFTMQRVTTRAAGDQSATLNEQQEVLTIGVSAVARVSSRSRSIRHLGDGDTSILHLLGKCGSRAFPQFANAGRTSHFKATTLDSSGLKLFRNSRSDVVAIMQTWSTRAFPSPQNLLIWQRVLDTP